MKMISRPIYIKQLTNFINKPQIKIITGIRRSGKSTVLRLLKEELLKSGVKEEQLILINFESFVYTEFTTAVKLYELGDSSKPDTLKYNVNVLWNSSIASDAKGGLSVAPNPANNMVNVNGVASKTPYTICDLNGKILLKGTLNPNDQSINISVLSSGVYVLNMQSAGAQKQAQRLVVQ